MPSATEPDAPDSDMVITPEDDPVPLDEFCEDQYLSDSHPAIKFSLETGREFEQKVEAEQEQGILGTEESEVTVRTKPDPTLRAYEKGDSYLITLSVPHLDIVFFAFQTDADLSPAIVKLVAQIEQDYDGIKAVHDFDGKLGYEDTRDAVEAAVTTFVEGKAMRMD